MAEPIEYPKQVYSKLTGDKVIVHSREEEDHHVPPEKPAKPTAPAKP